MPKGQQRGNKEARKPKKAAPAAPVPVASAGVPPAKATPLRWPKK